MASGNDTPVIFGPMTCSVFEALLSEALDGTLSPQAQERFAGHRASCAACGLMFREAEAGLGWLQGLKQADVEPPSHLLHQILAATSGVTTGRQPGLAGEGWFQGLRAWGRSALGPAFRPSLQPRFAMSFAMAFFSISILLNLTGVRLGDLRADDLKPTMISSRAMQGWGRVQKYYDNLRLVYEIESRVRELRNATTEEPATGNPAGSKDKNKTNRKDNTSGHPERRQNDDQYSSEFSGDTMAKNNSALRQFGNSAISKRSEV